MKNKRISSILPSERELARRAGVSRTTLRLFKVGDLNATLTTINRIAEAQGLQTELLWYPKMSEISPEFSVPVVSSRVVTDGFDSWKRHFFEMVDEFRRCKDPRLFIVPPVKKMDSRLKALLAAVVIQLCKEVPIAPPHWAIETKRLPQPWFVSKMNSLRASAIHEAPVAFKQKNIFVLGNFLERL